MNQAQWKTYARHSHTAASKQYRAKKHNDKVQKKVARPAYKSIPFAVELRDDDVVMFPNSTSTWSSNGMAVGHVYAPYSPNMRVTHGLQHIGKEQRICADIKRIHKEICSCKHFLVGKIKTAVRTQSGTLSLFRVSCQQIELLEFQLAFEDDLHDCFNHSEIS